ncbi:substrate-binding domain-containing protein [Algicella marina]|uniref:LacI family DNA-binding transcriptional regulator n=1 Tax=Algicella marina TaxID=2683284 RepID=A0A6P1T4F5_9RHOB|nr:substrate-binding domain-containing protein [Algicella marina]QHQ36573.1 LacI family DNA-binding transcriptional regulator [Algicella marina]
MNLKRLSELLELSPTTVSRALNGYPEVNAETRKRVLAAAKSHGYAANTMARRLATGRAMAIGHVVPLAEHDMINPIFADFLAGAGEVYSSSGYNMIVSVVSVEREIEAYQSMAASQNVDGVIVHAPLANDRRFEVLEALGLPFVAHGRGEDAARYSWVDIRNRKAFRQATERFIHCGHRRIGLINGMKSMTFAQRRHAGYCDALSSAGLSVAPELVRHSDMTEPYGYETANEMLDLADPPTAFLASSLMIAFGINRAITERGLMLGRDISVITHDDALPFLPNGGDSPVFASIRSPIRGHGRRAAEILIDLIEERKPGPVTDLWEVEQLDGPSIGPGPFANERATA